MLLLAAWAGSLAAMLVWLGRTPATTLRDQLVRWQFWSLELTAYLALAAGAYVITDISKRLSRQDALRMLVLATVAAGLTLFVAPRTNRIFYDEQIYQGIGHNLADQHRAQMCLDGNVEYGRLECVVGEYNKQPYAYPHLLSLVYRIAGVDERWAFLLNAVANALTVCAVFLVTLLLFEDRTAALLAGLVLSLTPHQLIWSATAAVEPMASLACLTAVVGMANFVRVRTVAALAAAGLLAAYAIQFRVESILIFAVVALLLVALAREELFTPALWWVALGVFALTAMHLAQLYSVRAEGWGTTEARLSLRYVVPNFRVNGLFYVADERFPVLYTVLALVGLLHSPRAIGASLLTYFLAFFGIGLLFYAGSYDYGADIRYSLMTYPPLAVLAGVGGARLAHWLEQTSLRKRTVRLVSGGLVIQFLWYSPVVRATTQEAWAARADVGFAKAVAKTLPPNSYVLTHNPGMFHLWRVNAGQLSLVIDQPARLQMLSERYAGGVYLHWNFWCNVADPVQKDLCRRAAETSSWETTVEYRERDARYRFDRLVSPHAPVHKPQ